MKSIKSFIYLDTEKMYSISSQIFEGLTEYIVKSNEHKSKEETDQKGPLMSGRIMADIIESNTSHTEKKFLHHYSYNLFESELEKEGKVLFIDQSCAEEKYSELSKYSFFKIKGRVVFNDAESIDIILENFNKLGEAIGYIVAKAQHDSSLNILKSQLAMVTNESEKMKLENQLKKKVNLKEMAKSNSFHLDEDQIKNLRIALDFGYNNQFELQLPISTDRNHFLFSALLKREMFVETEEYIVKKYSRQSEKEFTLFGILTQSETDTENVSLFGPNEATTMKESLGPIISAVTTVENSFFGKLPYEYIIDPIAVYREI